MMYTLSQTPNVSYFWKDNWTRCPPPIFVVMVSAHCLVGTESISFDLNLISHPVLSYWGQQVALVLDCLTCIFLKCHSISNIDPGPHLSWGCKDGHASALSSKSKCPSAQTHASWGLTIPRSSTRKCHVCPQDAGEGGVPGDRCVLGGSVSAWTWTSAYRIIRVLLPDLEPTGFLSPQGSLCEARVGHEDP